MDGASDLSLAYGRKNRIRCFWFGVTGAARVMQAQVKSTDATSMEEALTPPKAAARPGRLAFWLKVLFTTAVFIAIFATVDWSQAVSRLEQAQPAVVAAAFGTLLVSIVLASLRWSLVAHQHGIPLSFKLGLRVTFAAHFFGQILPSAVGADAVRSWFAVRRGLAVVPVVASVIVDRISGLLGLTFLIIIGLPRLLNLAGLEDSLVVVVPALLFVVGVVGAVALLLAAQRFRLRGVAGRVQDLLLGSAKVIASTNGLAAICLSIVVQGLVVMSVILIAWSVGLSFGLSDGLATVPAAMLVAFLPVTVNGWGLREGAMITAMGLAGISSVDALVVSVLFGIGLLLASLPGALAWFSLRADT